PRLVAPGGVALRDQQHEFEDGDRLMRERRPPAVDDPLHLGLDVADRPGQGLHPIRLAEDHAAEDAAVDYPIRPDHFWAKLGDDAVEARLAGVVHAVHDAVPIWVDDVVALNEVRTERRLAGGDRPGDPDDQRYALDPRLRDALGAHRLEG